MSKFGMWLSLLQYIYGSRYGSQPCFFRCSVRFMQVELSRWGNVTSARCARVIKYRIGCGKPEAYQGLRRREHPTPCEDRQGRRQESREIRSRQMDRIARIYTHGHDSLQTEDTETVVRPVYQDKDDDEEQPYGTWTACATRARLLSYSGMPNGASNTSITPRWAGLRASIVNAINNCTCKFRE